MSTKPLTVNPAGPITVMNGDSCLTLPIVCEPIWTPQMGERLMIARLYKCRLIDRRRWMHGKDIYPYSIYYKCECMSQPELARQLCVSQSVISKVETGKTRRAPIKVQSLYSVFGEETALYILLGVNAAKHRKYWRMTGEGRFKEK